MKSNLGEKTPLLKKIDDLYAYFRSLYPSQVYWKFATFSKTRLIKLSIVLLVFDFIKKKECSNEFRALSSSLCSFSRNIPPWDRAGGRLVFLISCR